jgi:hypothetical protein
MRARHRIVAQAGTTGHPFLPWNDLALDGGFFGHRRNALSYKLVALAT